MTLRVRISIVPFGDETKEREIHQINISNLGEANTKECNYGIELDEYKSGSYLGRVAHVREQGAITLVYKALKRILELGA